MFRCVCFGSLFLNLLGLGIGGVGSGGEDSYFLEICLFRLLGFWV